MSTDLFIFTLLYILICFGIIYPPIEFVSAGFTISSIFSKFLGSENERFIQYHIRRSTLTFLIHCLLPLGYILLFFITYGFKEVLLLSSSDIFKYFTVTSLILTVFAIFKIYIWSRNNWNNHPICNNLKKFCNTNTNWESVASNINIEFRRIDKMCIQTNSIIKVITTDNWVLKVTPYNINCAHQSDTALVVCSSDTHDVSITNRNEIQFINIEVISTRFGVLPFYIRLNALDFKDLQDKWSRPITVLPNVTFHKTLLDRFIDAFKEQIQLNEKYKTNQELELCIGCMQSRANVKLQKLCIDEINENITPGELCVNCYCRPMWCTDCMARWFASRQNENEPNIWLASKCTCPVCRAKFCIYDVSLIENES